MSVLGDQVTLANGAMVDVSGRQAAAPRSSAAITKAGMPKYPMLA